MAEFAVGSTFADHVVRGVAGRGGMGVVYRAMHLPLKREVALKVIAPELSADAEFRERFRREFEAAASIVHPNVVPIFHAGEEDGLLYVTMRYVDGTDLSRLLVSSERLEPGRAVRLIAQVAEALDAAHARGIVHRDVKPGNVLIEADGGDGHALLTDFGLGKDLDAARNLTQVGIFVGTLDYAAPEQLKGGTIDARTDVYALGCVLYHVLTGRVPYPAESDAAKMFAHIESPPPLLTALVGGMPSGLDAVVRRAMAKDPGARYATAGELGHAALAALDDRYVSTAVTRTDMPVSAPGPQSSQPPLPPALTNEVGVGPFVGREDVLELMMERYQRAAAGRPQFILLCGEPGIGKTRLASELARMVHAERANVLYGRSDAESLVPYQPFITAIQHRVAHRRTLDFPEELGPELAELGRFIPALRRQAPTLHDPIAEEPETRRFRLFEAVTRLLAFVAREHPMVLIMDDLQWADTSTALLLGHLLSDVEPVPLLVVGTFRESVGCRCEEITDLITRMRRRAEFERISLAGLSRAETQALIAAHDGLGATEAFVGQLREHTEGNPFFIEETLRSLEELGPREPGGNVVLEEDELDRIAVPEGVKDVIGRRLARLSETAAQVLAVASVVGREFRLELLEELIDQSSDRIISALEEAAEAGLVREVPDDVDRFLFAHALMRETLYEQQSATRRVRLHHQIAEALERLADRFGANPAELAHHYFESRHRDRAGKAIIYALRAAEQAADALAYEEAAEHYERALAALESGKPDEPRMCAVLLGLGSVQSRAGNPAGRESFARAAELARRQGLPEQLARAALGFVGRYAATGVVDREGVDLLEEALATLGEQESPLVVRLMARLADSLHFAAEEERTAALSRAALEMAERIGDSGALVVALESRHAALLYIKYLPERLRLGEQLLELAVRTGERELEGLGHHWRIYDLLEAADPDSARREHQALVRLAEELRQPLYQHFAIGWDVVWAQMAGRVAEAERLARQGYELGVRALARDASTIYAAQLLTLRRREDRLSDYVSTVESFVEKHPAFVTWRTVLPLAHLAAGNVEAAVEEFERFAADDFKTVPHDMLWFTGTCVLSEACSLLRDAPRAAILYELLVPFRDRNVQVTQAACWGSAERFLGLLAAAMSDYDLASEHFERALERNTAAGVHPILPIIRREYAEMLVIRGTREDVARAGELLRATLVAAETAGMAQLAESVRRRIEEIERGSTNGHSVTSVSPPRELG